MLSGGFDVVGVVVRTAAVSVRGYEVGLVVAGTAVVVAVEYLEG